MGQRDNRFHDGGGIGIRREIFDEAFGRCITLPLYLQGSISGPMDSGYREGSHPA
jgi:hypothetical protein